MADNAGTDDITWEDLHPETRRLLSRRQMIGTTGKMAASFAVFGGILTVVGCSTDNKNAAPTTTGGGGTTTGAPTTTTTATKGTAAPGSLYTRLGGNTAITAVVGTFVDNVVADKKINTFFANSDPVRLKLLLVEFVANATGGPEKYTGRNMVETHKNMKITTADFDALVGDLVASLDTYKVPAKEKTELLDALGPLKPQIVTA